MVQAMPHKTRRSDFRKVRIPMSATHATRQALAMAGGATYRSNGLARQVSLAVQRGSVRRKATQSL